jgi:hypothetical protein
MDKEFHYDINYLIALYAGFDQEAATKIAYSAQFVDDNNDICIVLNELTQEHYVNAITQTYDITKVRPWLVSMYAAFHFLPGEQAAASRRKDRLWHPLCTTPDAPLAKNLLTRALESGNLHWIGIASHAYCDTWAHQNFIGDFHTFNNLPGVKSIFGAAVGHASALAMPDEVSKIWQDKRLANPRANNKKRFIQAAKNLYLLYTQYTPKKVLSASSLLLDLDYIFGEAAEYHADYFGNRRRGREARFVKVLEKRRLPPLPSYNKEQWRTESLIPAAEIDASALIVEVKEKFKLAQFSGICLRKSILALQPIELGIGAIDLYRWRTQGDWYHFQEAAKIHYEEAYETIGPLIAEEK